MKIILHYLHFILCCAMILSYFYTQEKMDMEKYSQAEFRRYLLQGKLKKSFRLFKAIPRSEKAHIAISGKI